MTNLAAPADQRIGPAVENRRGAILASRGPRLDASSSAKGVATAKGWFD
jgi:hypothetical protein